MKNTWFTIRDLVGLPGLPGTPNNILKKAKKECWEKRRRPKGKGLEYHITSLPLETQSFINGSQHAAEMVTTGIAARIKEIVEKSGNKSLFQKKIGISGSEIYGVISEKVQPKAEFIARLYKSGIDIDYLLFGNGDNSEQTSFLSQPQPAAIDHTLEGSEVESRIVINAENGANIHINFHKGKSA